MKNKIVIKSTTTTIILFISTFLIPLSAQAEPLDATVTVNSPEIVEIGNNFNVTITISYVEDFDAANFDVTYNPEIINVTEVTGGEINNTNLPCAWNFINDGRIRLIINLPGLSGVTGEGHLAEIQFETITTGTSNINLSNGIIANKTVQPITAQWNNDTVQIEGIELPEVSIKLSSINLFKTKIYFENTGEIDILDMKWNIQMDSALTDRINFLDNGTIETLNTGEEKTISSEKIGSGIGFVKIKIKATVNEHNFNKEFNGLKIGPILLILA